MFSLEMPPQPPWEGIHPLVVHFPIALLFVAPLFVLLAGVLGKYGRWFGLTALMLLVMGTVGGAVAVSSGDAAYHALEDIEDGGWEVVEQHQQAAKSVQNWYVGLTVLYAVLLAVPLVVTKCNQWKYWLPANLVFMAILMVVNIQLANAAHLGGRLVHQYGARALLSDEYDRPQPAGEEAAADFDEAAFDDLMGWLTDDETDETDEEVEEAADDEAVEEAADEPMEETSDESDDP